MAVPYTSPAQVAGPDRRARAGEGLSAAEEMAAQMETIGRMDPSYGTDPEIQMGLARMGVLGGQQPVLAAQQLSAMARMDRLTRLYGEVAQLRQGQALDEDAWEYLAGKVEPADLNILVSYVPERLRPDPEWLQPDQDGGFLGRIAGPVRAVAGAVDWALGPADDLAMDLGGKALHAWDVTARFLTGNVYRAMKLAQEEHGEAGVLRFWEYMDEASNGERVISREGRRKAYDLIAGETQDATRADVLYRYAVEFAAEQNVEQAIEKVAGLSPDDGERFQREYAAVQQLYQESGSVLGRATEILNNHHFSLGRTFALSFGLNPSEGLGKILSGGLDATFLILGDPTNLVFGLGVSRGVVGSFRYGLRGYRAAALGGEAELVTGLRRGIFGLPTGFTRKTFTKLELETLGPKLHVAEVNRLVGQRGIRRFLDDLAETLGPVTRNADGYADPLQWDQVRRRYRHMVRFADTFERWKNLHWSRGATAERLTGDDIVEFLHHQLGRETIVARQFGRNYGPGVTFPALSRFGPARLNAKVGLTSWMDDVVDLRHADHIPLPAPLRAADVIDVDVSMDGVDDLARHTADPMEVPSPNVVDEAVEDGDDVLADAPVPPGPGGEAGPVRARDVVPPPGEATKKKPPSQFTEDDWVQVLVHGDRYDRPYDAEDVGQASWENFQRAEARIAHWDAQPATHRGVVDLETGRLGRPVPIPGAPPRDPSVLWPQATVSPVAEGGWPAQAQAQGRQIFETAEPPAAEGMTRLYRIQGPGTGNDRWFTTREAAYAAAPPFQPGQYLHYQDHPVPSVARWGDDVTGYLIPAEDFPKWHQSGTAAEARRPPPPSTPVPRTETAVPPARPEAAPAPPVKVKARELGDGTRSPVIRGVGLTPFRRLGRFMVAVARDLTTEMPRNTGFHLLDDVAEASWQFGSAVEEFARFLESIGRMAGIQRSERAQLLNEFVQAGDVASRRQLIRGLHREMFDRLGYGDPNLPHMQEVGQRFMDMLHRYAPGRIDLIARGEEVIPAAIAPIAHASYLMAAPTMEELILAARKSGLLSQFFGWGSDGLKAGMAIWRPAVLMRPGFLIRVSGDEVLAYMARDGFRKWANGLLFGVGRRDDALLGLRTLRRWARSVEQYGAGRVPGSELVRNSFLEHFGRAMGRPIDWMSRRIRAGARLIVPQHVWEAGLLLERNPWYRATVERAVYGGGHLKAAASGEAELRDLGSIVTPDDPMPIKLAALREGHVEVTPLDLAYGPALQIDLEHIGREPWFKLGPAAEFQGGVLPEFHDDIARLLADTDGHAFADPLEFLDVYRQFWQRRSTLPLRRAVESRVADPDSPVTDADLLTLLTQATQALGRGQAGTAALADRIVRQVIDDAASSLAKTEGFAHLMALDVGEPLFLVDLDDVARRFTEAYVNSAQHHEVAGALGGLERMQQVDGQPVPMAPRAHEAAVFTVMVHLDQVREVQRLTPDLLRRAEQIADARVRRAVLAVLRDPGSVTQRGEDAVAMGRHHLGLGRWGTTDDRLARDVMGELNRVLDSVGVTERPVALGLYRMDTDYHQVWAREPAGGTMELSRRLDAVGSPDRPYAVELTVGDGHLVHFEPVVDPEDLRDLAATPLDAGLRQWWDGLTPEDRDTFRRWYLVNRDRGLPYGYTAPPPGTVEVWVPMHDGRLEGRALDRAVERQAQRLAGRDVTVVPTAGPAAMGAAAHQGRGLVDLGALDAIGHLDPAYTRLYRLVSDAPGRDHSVWFIDDVTELAEQAYVHRATALRWLDVRTTTLGQYRQADGSFRLTASHAQRAREVPGGGIASVRGLWAGRPPARARTVLASETPAQQAARARFERSEATLDQLADTRAAAEAGTPAPPPGAVEPAVLEAESRWSGELVMDPQVVRKLGPAAQGKTRLFRVRRPGDPRTGPQRFVTVDRLAAETVGGRPDQIRWFDVPTEELAGFEPITEAGVAVGWRVPRDRARRTRELKGGLVPPDQLTPPPTGVPHVGDYDSLDAFHDDVGAWASDIETRHGMPTGAWIEEGETAPQVAATRAEPARLQAEIDRLDQAILDEEHRIQGLLGDSENYGDFTTQVDPVTGAVTHVTPELSALRMERMGLERQLAHARTMAARGAANRPAAQVQAELEEVQRAILAERHRLGPPTFVIPHPTSLQLEAMERWLAELQEELALPPPTGRAITVRVEPPGRDAVPGEAARHAAVRYADWRITGEETTLPEFAELARRRAAWEADPWAASGQDPAEVARMAAWREERGFPPAEPPARPDDLAPSVLVTRITAVGGELRPHRQEQLLEAIAAGARFVMPDEAINQPVLDFLLQHGAQVTITHETGYVGLRTALPPVTGGPPVRYAGGPATDFGRVIELPPSGLRRGLVGQTTDPTVLVGRDPAGAIVANRMAINRDFARNLPYLRGTARPATTEEAVRALPALRPGRRRLLGVVQDDGTVHWYTLLPDGVERDRLRWIDASPAELRDWAATHPIPAASQTVGEELGDAAWRVIGGPAPGELAEAVRHALPHEWDEAIRQLPPVPEGHTRLWRAEWSDDMRARGDDELREIFQDLDPQDAAERIREIRRRREYRGNVDPETGQEVAGAVGRWYGEDLNNALFYVRDRDYDQLSYLDVTDEELEAWRVINLGASEPVAHQKSYNRFLEWFVDEEALERSRIVGAPPGAGPARFQPASEDVFSLDLEGVDELSRVRLEHAAVQHELFEYRLGTPDRWFGHELETLPPEGQERMRRLRDLEAQRDVLKRRVDELSARRRARQEGAQRAPVPVSRHVPPEEAEDLFPPGIAVEQMADDPTITFDNASALLEGVPPDHTRVWGYIRDDGSRDWYRRFPSHLDATPDEILFADVPTSVVDSIIPAPPPPPRPAIVIGGDPAQTDQVRRLPRGRYPGVPASVAHRVREVPDVGADLADTLLMGEHLRAMHIDVDKLQAVLADRGGPRAYREFLIRREDAHARLGTGQGVRSYDDPNVLAEEMDATVVALQDMGVDFQEIRGADTVVELAASEDLVDFGLHSSGLRLGIQPHAQDRTPPMAQLHAGRRLRLQYSEGSRLERAIEEQGYALMSTDIDGVYLYAHQARSGERVAIVRLARDGDPLRTSQRGVDVLDGAAYRRSIEQRGTETLPNRLNVGPGYTPPDHQAAWLGYADQLTAQRAAQVDGTRLGVVHLDEDEARVARHLADDGSVTYHLDQSVEPRLVGHHRDAEGNWVPSPADQPPEQAQRLVEALGVLSPQDRAHLFARWERGEPVLAVGADHAKALHQTAAKNVEWNQSVMQNTTLPVHPDIWYSLVSGRFDWPEQRIVDGVATRVHPNPLREIIERAAQEQRLPGRIVSPKYVVDEQAMRSRPLFDRVTDKFFGHLVGPFVDATARQPMFLNNLGEALRDSEGLVYGLANFERLAPLDAHAARLGLSRDEAALKFAEALRKPRDSTFSQEVLDDVREGVRHWEWVRRRTDRVAVQAAMERTIPFIDDSRMKSVFAARFRNWFPFWYAEQQFYMRWARTVKLNPRVIRRAQLTLNGAQASGYVEENQYGELTYRVPGMGMLQALMGQSLHHLLGVVGVDFNPRMVDLVVSGALTQTLPGFSGPGGGLPAGPALTIPLNVVQDKLRHTFPELVHATDVLMPNRSAGRAVVDQVVPVSVTRLYRAIMADEGDVGFANYMVAAAAQLEATGHGLAEDATPTEKERWMDRVRDTARNLALIQWATGLFSPAAPILTVSQHVRDGGQHDPLDLFRGTDLGTVFVDLLNHMPHDQALTLFIELYPDATPYTVFPTESVFGAPLPAHEHAGRWMVENAQLLRDNPAAAVWLLPTEMPDDAYSRSARADQFALGLRERKDLETYWRDLKWAAAAEPYFRERDLFNARQSATPDPYHQDLQELEYQRWRRQYLYDHPVFAEMLTSGEAAQRRRDAITDMTRLLGRTDLPMSEALPGIRRMQTAYLQWVVRDEALSVHTDRATRAERAQTQAQFLALGERLAQVHPAAAPYWYSVLRSSIEVLAQPDEPAARADRTGAY